MSSPDAPLPQQSRGHWHQYDTDRSPGDQGSIDEQQTVAAFAATGSDPTKQEYRMTVDAAAAPFDDLDEIWTTSKSTPKDAADMKRMGKQQQLVRRFQFLPTVSFVALATAAWEIGLFVLTPGLVDGGRAGLVWNVLWNIVDFSPIYLSMAEMASMAPIAGAQYHWVSGFAPESCQRILSYISSWTSTIARQAGDAQGLFLVGSLVQTMILLNDDRYGFPSWQGTLLAFMAVAMAYTGVVYGAKVLPYWQTAVFIVHVAPTWATSFLYGLTLQGLRTSKFGLGSRTRVAGVAWV
ncbi:hypothetical protein LTS10_013004 [Elasticomyces elasticus]|nr:hypothetical protein LTS10_013004 [Elasticomyces elasticus]